MTVEEAKFSKAIGQAQGPGGMDLLDYFMGQLAAKPFRDAEEVSKYALKLVAARQQMHAELRAAAYGKAVQS